MSCMFTWVCVNPAPALFDVLFQGHGEMILFKSFIDFFLFEGLKKLEKQCTKTCYSSWLAKILQHSHLSDLHCRLYRKFIKKNQVTTNEFEMLDKYK